MGTPGMGDKITDLTEIDGDPTPHADVDLPLEDYEFQDWATGWPPDPVTS
jgi:hypothetical protein